MTRSNAKIMVSPKRLAANRANALHSMGPQTARGKSISSSNSRSHGLCMGQGLLPCEDPVEFQEFAERYFSQLNPQGPIEEDLVKCLVWLSWKCTVRLPRTEAQVMKALEFHALELAHRKRIADGSEQYELAGLRSLSDSVLIEEAEGLRLAGGDSAGGSLEQIARGKAMGTELGKIRNDALDADEETGKPRLERLSEVELRQAHLEAEAARRVAASEEVSLGREFLFDIQSGTNALDRLHRHGRDILADFVRVGRELERLVAARDGRVLSNLTMVDVNQSGGGKHGN